MVAVDGQDERTRKTQSTRMSSAGGVIQPLTLPNMSIGRVEVTQEVIDARVGCSRRHTAQALLRTTTTTMATTTAPIQPKVVGSSSVGKGSNQAFNDKVSKRHLSHVRDLNSYREYQGKPQEVRLSNMTAAKGTRICTCLLHKSLNMLHKAISDAVRTSLGPKGMDKMVR